MKARIVVLISLLGAANLALAIPTTIAQWTFETSVPTTQGPISPEIGSGTATASIGGAISNPVGNGSAESWSSSAWDVGDYWQFQIDSRGLEKISLRWDQTSSATGPGSFGLFYSTDGVLFTQFGVNYTVLLNDSPNTPWSTGTYRAAYTLTRDLTSITALNNDSSVYFRLQDMTTTSANGGTVTPAGTSRIDNFTVTGEAIASVPDTGATAILLSMPLLGVFALRRFTTRPV